jgi:hypothetical protein
MPTASIDTVSPEALLVRARGEVADGERRRVRLAALLCCGASVGGDFDVRELLADAVREGAGSLVAEALLAQPDLDEAARATLREFLHAAMAEELWRGAAERRILKRLHEAGLRCLVLKGGALAHWLYPRPHLRPRGDLDLMFANRNDVDRAQTALAELGLAWDGVLSNGPAFERVLVGEWLGRPFQVDAHWRLVAHPAFARCLEFPELECSAQSVVALGGALALSAPHALMHLALHRASDLLHGPADRLVWLYDTHLLAQRLTASDWSEFVAVARARRIAGPCSEALRAASRYLRSEIPKPVLAALAEAAGGEPFRMALADRRWYFELHALALQPWWRVPRHLLEKLFPSPDYMMQRYRLSRRSQLPAAYLRRLGSGWARVLVRRPIR